MGEGRLEVAESGLTDRSLALSGAQSSQRLSNPKFQRLAPTLNVVYTLYS